MKAIKILSGLVLATMLFSFMAPGGEHFQISVNGTSVIKCSLYQKKPIEWLMLDKNTPGNISVTYDLCGQTSKGRKLAVVDSKNSIVKEWKFEDVPASSNGAMSIEVKEVTSLLSKATSQLNLFYSSADLPDGRVLAHLKLDGMKVAKK